MDAKRSKRQALVQFQPSSIKYELLKPKNADILEIKGEIKKVHCAKKS